MKVSVSIKNPNLGPLGLSSRRSVSVFSRHSPLLRLDSTIKMESWDGNWRWNQQRRMVVKASSNWTDAKSPYDTLGILFGLLFLIFMGFVCLSKTPHVLAE